MQEEYDEIGDYQDELPQEPVYEIHLEIDGVKFLLSSFQFNLAPMGRSSVLYTASLEFAHHDEASKKMLNHLINQDKVSFVITEGDSGGLVFTDVEVSNMYNFKSFSCETEIKPAFQ